MGERTFGNLRVDGVASVGAFQGAPYGGKPVTDRRDDVDAQPGAQRLAARHACRKAHKGEFDVGATALGGTLGVLPTGRLPFADLYERYGLLAHGSYGPLDLQAEQWYGDDHDADGFLTNQHSSGGYVRLKYYPIPHAYFGLRYDAYAIPFITRDFVYYGAVQIAPFRILCPRGSAAGPTSVP